MLHVQAERDDEVGAVEFGGVAGFHGNGVRVLDAGGETLDLDELAADFTREIREIGNGRDDANGRTGPAEADEQEEEEKVAKKGLHDKV